jgi:hypothetical protein
MMSWRRGAKTFCALHMTEWRIPDSPPEDLELTSEQFEELKETLASPNLQKQTCTQQELIDAGYCCWLQYMMYRLSAVIKLD